MGSLGRLTGGVPGGAWTGLAAFSEEVAPLSVLG